MIDAWHHISLSLEKNLTPGHYQLWIKPLQGCLDNDTLVLCAPNSFVSTWVRDRMLDKIRVAAAETLGFAPSIEVCAVQADAPAPVRVKAGPAKKIVSRQMGLPMAHALPTQTVQNWRHQFDDFIVGPCNNLAYVASRSFCQDAQGSDQLFLCSAPGLGKTHLAQAIGSEIARQTNRQHLRVCYLSGEEFSSQLVMAIKAKAVEQFKARFRSNVDLLLLEDVHFFQGKEKMQDELLNTLKSLQNQGRRVVMTSTFLPRELSDIDANLLSRFAQGFMAVIDKPDYQTRMGIIQAKSQASQVSMPGSVAELLADRIKTDVRQLESCLKNIILKAKLLNMDITMDLAWEILQNYNLDSASIDLDKIISFVCQAYGFGFDDLRSKSRKRDRVIARNTAFYLARKHTDLSLMDIGRRFNRKHSTVIKGIASVEQEVTRKTSLGNQLARTINQLHA
ncbi:MAG: chromosomal replication initiator protein DnaA [Deltaproteobacteria bacterium HGW-Deltaproteobacteria-18]|jgi:chromosomal replication initiator protein|nr:MAG: chromosomal replication initiator protein DnaA [Deltaproteobacteria bacterium HGW-Deltaproteobacteria-18]